MGPTLFVSDVHLRANDPAANRSFARFLEQPCEALYLVGDLFDYWIGPKHLPMSDYREELRMLKRISERTKLFFIKGNRDYLVEEKFERATGAKVLGDRAQVELAGRTILLAHGDFLFNTNPRYTAYRTLMRSKPIEALWHQLPAFVGRAVGRGFRKVSPMTTSRYAWSPDRLLARARPFFEEGADMLITGHIHQPQHLTDRVKGRRCDLYVMGDWCGGTQDYILCDGRDFHFLPWG